MLNQKEEQSTTLLWISMVIGKLKMTPIPPNSHCKKKKPRQAVSKCRNDPNQPCEERQSRHGWEKIT